MIRKAAFGNKTLSVRKYCVVVLIVIGVIRVHLNDIGVHRG